MSRLSRFKQFLDKPRHIRSTHNGERTNVPIGPRGELYDVDPLTLEPIARVYESTSETPSQSSVASGQAVPGARLPVPRG
jgi:hypothetical protein